MHRLSSRLVIGLLALAWLAPPAFAQWIWRGAHGVINISDLPPPRGTPEKDILQRVDPLTARPARNAASAPALELPAKLGAEPELQAKKKAADQEKAAKEKAEAERLAVLRQENCRNARNYMASLDSGMRIARTNDRGEREVLDDKQRAAEIERVRAVMASDCR